MIVERVTGALLRWRIILRVVAVGLPFLVGFLLGLLWLREHGFFVEFAVVSGALGLLAYLCLKIPLWLQPRERGMKIGAPTEHHVTVNLDWSSSERVAFDAGLSLIDKELVKPIPVEDIQPFALEVIRAVARASGQTGKSEFDFTVPEALLLVERVASGLRSDLRSYISISDRISVGTLLWLWRNQERTRKIYGLGHAAYRLFRAGTNLPVAVIREISDAVTSGNTAMLTGELHLVGQRILFEEIAKAATELYSGRLRMSDAELLDSILQDADIDRERLAAPDAPLRIAIAGQVSAGKSSLMNALLRQDVAETDMSPSTERATVYMGEILGMPCHIVDLPGLDGSGAASQVTIEEVFRSDILIWVIPVNRPGREIDRATISDIQAGFEELQDRRVPPLIGAVTFCDRLAGAGWPYPEHNIPMDVQTKIGDAVRSIKRELAINVLIPVSLGDNEWNMSALFQTLEAHFFEAMNVQRNRVRLTHGKRSIGRDAVDTVQGLGRGVWKIGKRAVQHYSASSKK